MGVRVKGFQEIKTLASILGSGCHSNERHVHQFQLASLELERTRRAREKQAAFRRIKDVDARIAEIDGLIRKHQDALNLKVGEVPSQGHPAAARNNGEAAPERRRVLHY